jgi:hypothetical protein
MASTSRKCVLSHIGLYHSPSDFYSFLVRPAELPGSYHQIHLVARQEKLCEEMAIEFCLRNMFPLVVLFNMHKIKQHGATALLPLRRKSFYGYFALQNPSSWAGSEPANLASIGKYATTRPRRTTSASLLRMGSLFCLMFPVKTTRVMDSRYKPTRCWFMFRP